MGLSRGKKVLIGVGGVVGLLVVALAVAPSFIDVNSYKPMIVAEAKKATGRDLAISGPINLSLLPTPSVSVSGISFANMPGAKNPKMLELKSASVKPSLFALLGGKVEIAEVILVEPRIALEVGADGKASWDFTPPGVDPKKAAEAKPAAAKGGATQPISVGRLVVENGALSYNDAKAGLSMAAEKANLTASVGSLEGPFALAGNITVNGAPLKLDLSLGAKAAGGLPASVAVEAGGGKLGFKGTLSELGPNAKVAGAATVSAESLTGFLGALIQASGQPETPLPALLAGKFSFEGGLDASPDSVALRNFKIALGADSGSGSLAVALKPAMTVDGKIVVPKLDLDKWMAALSRPSTSTAAVKTAPSSTTKAPSSGGAVPSNLAAKFALEVGEAIYNKAPIRNVAFEIEVRGGAIAVPRLTASLPGDMILQARSTMSGDSAKPVVSGDFSLVGPKLRDTLNWLAVDVSSVPASKLNRLSLKGRMASVGGNVQVTDAAFELDDLKGTGGVVATFGVPLSVVAHVDLDTLDLDSFLTKPASGQKPATAPVSGSAPATPSSQPVAGPSIGFKGKLARLIYNKETVGGIEVDIVLQGNVLKLNDFKVANLGGARLAVRGSVANFPSAMPRPDITFNFDAPDMGKVMKVVGAAGPDGMGAASASGGVAGTVEALTLKDLSVAAMGNTVKASGALSLPGAARGAPQAVGYKGSVTLNGQTIEGSVDAKLTGKPNIVADLKAAALDFDKLAGSGGRAPARSQPPATAAAAGSKPIDTSAMRSVDASIKFVAASLSSGPLKMTNADLAVALKDGVLTLQHFKGALYGGSLALSGVVDGSKPALAFDFKGDANSIFLGEMLRSTQGTNQFGSVAKVTIDGKLNATGLSIKGSGTTPDQIKGSMAGGAQLGGHVFAGADKALVALGSAATGAVGGAIDSTLGSLMGAAGQKGGVGAGNILNAISLVLNRFVNNDSPIAGRIDIASGVLTDKGLTVQGKGVTAAISTRTNLVASATDTRINFTISEDTSAPYLITTVKGPMSGLSYDVQRGSAKDPPGATSTLGGGAQQTAPAGGQQKPASPAPGGVQIPKIFGR